VKEINNFYEALGRREKKTGRISLWIRLRGKERHRGGRREHYPSPIDVIKGQGIRDSALQQEEKKRTIRTLDIQSNSARRERKKEKAPSPTSIRPERGKESPQGSRKEEKKPQFMGGGLSEKSRSVRGKGSKQDRDALSPQTLSAMHSERKGKM